MRKPPHKNLYEKEVEKLKIPQSLKQSIDKTTVLKSVRDFLRLAVGKNNFTFIYNIYCMIMLQSFFRTFFKKNLFSYSNILKININSNWIVKTHSSITIYKI